MEISTTTSHATSEAKVTSHYWGCRELTADEVSAVSGGYDGDGGSADSGGDWGDSGGYAGNTAGTEVADATAAASQDVAGTFCTFAGIVVGVATTVATTSPALGAYLGFTTSWACEAQSGNLASNGAGSGSDGGGGGSEG
jgi:hypothetical protein